MTELARLALLGDKQAQEECTQKGVVLPCPCCASEKLYVDSPKYDSDIPKNRLNDIDCDYSSMSITCGECGICMETSENASFKYLLKMWNTRPSPPIGRCGECEHYRFVFSLDKPDGMRCVRERHTKETRPADYCSYFEPKEGTCDGKSNCG